MPDTMQLNRRAMLRHLMVLVGASATAPVSLSALAEVAKADRQFLDAQAFSTLSALADTIIPVTDTPGALAAQVPSNFDALLLNWAAPATKDALVSGLGRVDTASRTATGKPFRELSAEARASFLVEHEKAAMKPAPPPEDALEGGNPFRSIAGYVIDNGYRQMKELIVTLFYISEIGMTVERVYEHVPGKWIPSLEITTGMRTFASPGPL